MFDLMRQRPVCSTKKAFEMVCAGGGSAASITSHWSANHFSLLAFKGLLGPRKES